MVMTVYTHGECDANLIAYSEIKRGARMTKQGKKTQEKT